MQSEDVPVHILVVNSGSSSIKFSVFNSIGSDGASAPEPLLDGELDGIGDSTSRFRVSGVDVPQPERDVKAHNAAQAMQVVFDTVSGAHLPAIDAVGYRVVHPGAILNSHLRITPQVLGALEEASAFAPLHTPATIAVIREGLRRFPGIAHYACFDTIFHQTMPERAYTYAIPAGFREHGVRRYGFHGLSCESILRSMRTAGVSVPRRMAIAPLGSGCSITALIDGRSVDTTMGLTPTGGLIMGTRPGDLDPGVLLYLLRQQPNGDAAGAVESIVNHNSGMVALSGLPNDMRRVRKAADEGDPRARLAIDVFTRSITKAIGGFEWLMGGLDALVFTGGIGEHDPATRSAVLAGLEGLGVILDPQLNTATSEGLRIISSSASNVVILVIPAQEDLMIAVHVSQMAQPFD